MITHSDGNGDVPLTRIDVRVEGSAQGYVAGRDQYVTQQAPTPLTAVRTLPRDVAAFTGREAEVERIAAAAEPSRAMPILTLDGMPGVGKTALAVHAARRLADRYPDGQMFLRLNAHTPGQVSTAPADALAALLVSVGVDPRSVPDALDARAGLWRDRLAGRRMILLLDDAADHAQIEPLLPGAEGCLVLITSRHRLTALDGALPLALNILPPIEAALLFARLAHRSPTTAADTEAVAQIVELSGYLPLAIALLAGRFAHHPRWSLTEYAEEFASAPDRLDELAAGDRAVAAAFGMSYRALPAQRQRLFRRLGLHPGPDIEPYATAALAGMPLTQARHELETLYNDHLIDSPAPGRYRLHDLLRAYARALAGTGPASEDCDESTRRLLDYYHHTAEAADRYLAEAPRLASRVAVACPVSAPGVTSHEQAVAWLRNEHANLVACIYEAIRSARHSHAMRLTSDLAAFLRQQGHWEEAASLHRAAATSARLAGDRIGLANALAELGWVEYLTGDFSEAASLTSQALKLYRAEGNRLGEANALRELGWVHYLTCEYSEADDLTQQALKLYRALGNRLGEAYTLRELGWVRYATGDYQAAAHRARQALDISRSLGNRPGEALALRELGRVRYATGNYPAADELARQALGLYRALGNRLSEAYSLWDLGRVQAVSGNFEAAANLTQQALALFRALSNQHGEAHALRELGRTRHAGGDYSVAAELLQQSLALFQKLRDVQGQVEVLNSIGALLLASPGPGEAVSVYHQALGLARRIRSPLDEAHALEGIARCHVRTGGRTAAITNLDQAVEIYRRIRAAEASAAAEYLAQLQTQESPTIHDSDD